MIVGVPKETQTGERRVALVPALAPLLAKAGLEVHVETGAGEAAGFPDALFAEKGARLSDAATVYAANILLQVRTYGANAAAGPADLDRLRPGQLVLGMTEPLSAPERVQAMAERGVTALAMELIPRITRAQGMDALSSQATVAGYRAVILAASHLPRMFPMLMTAAGTISPARVLVIGAGVAGLQAIAGARRLGAVVQAYDVRPAVKEQVESLGAKFVELDIETTDAEDRGGYAKAQDETFYRRQREAMARVVAAQDVVIATAAIPGRTAPILVTAEMVGGMSPGSVIVDLAAERGGNCALTQPDRTVVASGVTILGPTNAPSDLPYHASQMYAKNLTNLLLHVIREGRPNLDAEDAIVKGTLLCRDGRVVHEEVLARLAPPPTAGEPA